MQNCKGKHWVFTYNNPPYPAEDFIKNIKALFEIEYIVIGNEIGEKGTPHFQGYIKFKKDTRFGSIQKAFQVIHWEPKKGSVLQAASYCKKDKNFIEEGTLPAEAAPLDRQLKWKVARQLAAAGDFEEIDDQIFVAHYNTIKNIHKDAMPPQPDLGGVCGIWLWGKAGVGKTQLTKKLWPDSYPKMLNKWWDGYQNQEVACLQDIDPSHAPWIGNFLKSWGDSVAFLGEIKGGAKSIRPKWMVVTSQYQIHEIFPDSHTQEALTRRYTVFEYIKGDHLNIEQRLKEHVGDVSNEGIPPGPPQEGGDSAVDLITPPTSPWGNPLRLSKPGLEEYDWGDFDKYLDN